MLIAYYLTWTFFVYPFPSHGGPYLNFIYYFKHLFIWNTKWQEKREGWAERDTFYLITVTPSVVMFQPRWSQKTRLPSFPRKMAEFEHLCSQLLTQARWQKTYLETEHPELDFVLELQKLVFSYLRHCTTTPTLLLTIF